MSEAPAKGEWRPLKPSVYNLVQWAVSHGMSERLYPARERALCWEGLPDRDILEVGCGTGSVDCRGVGVDLDPARARRVQVAGRPAAAADATRLPFPDGAFHRVFCEGVFHHMPDDCARGALAEMLRVCDPAGRVVLMDSVWPRSPFRVFGWVLRYLDFGRHVRTERQLREMISNSGAVVLSAERLTYNTIGLEGLIAVLQPGRQTARNPRR